MSENIINETIINLFDKIYPIGSIYISANEINPEQLFGGKWNKIENRFLLAAGDQASGSTGGTVKHTHNYMLGYRAYYNTPIGFGALDNFIASYDYDNKKWILTQRNSTIPESISRNSGTQSSYISQTGADGFALSGKTSSDSNLPPYLVVNMWQRIN